MTGRRRLRVLAIIASSDLGGAERVMASLLKGHDRDRFELFLACHGDGPMLDEYRRHAADVRVLDLVSIFRPRSILALTHLARRLGCQIVHTHLWTADVIGGLAATIARTPIRVATVHGSYFQVTEEGGLRRARKVALSRTYRRAYGLFDRVIAASRHTADDLVGRAGIRVDARKVTVVPNGLDLDRLSGIENGVDRRALGLSATAPVIATVANFVPVKGHRGLVEAVPRVIEQFPDATFLLVGDGPELPAIRRLVARANLEAHVRLLGLRPDALRLIALSDVVAIPSLSEATSIVSLEALALGKPVVATRVGAMPEVIEDRRTGVLVPAEDPQALADAICTILANPARAKAMGEAGRDVVRARFSLETMVQEIERVYVDLAMAKGVLAADD